MLIRFYTCPKCGGKGRPKGKNFATVQVCEDCGHTSSSYWFIRSVLIEGTLLFQWESANIKKGRVAAS